MDTISYLPASRGTRLSWPQKVDERCKNCGTVHRVPVEQDEDGYYVELDTTPCNDDHCTRRLCESCPQETCVACGLTFCPEHVEDFDVAAPLPDGSAAPKQRVCRDCRAEFARQDALG